MVQYFSPFLVLTAIISRFDRQLLGNKLSFAPCSMHILFDSNKFHKFWMSCACRNPLSKDHQMGKPPLPEAKWSDVVQCRRSGRPRGSGGRPPGLPQATRPKTEVSEETTQRTDVQKRSGAVHRKSVARWHTPRPASLGRAARPHLAASRLPASRVS